MSWLYNLTATLGEDCHKPPLIYILLGKESLNYSYDYPTEFPFKTVMPISR